MMGNLTEKLLSGRLVNGALRNAARIPVSKRKLAGLLKEAGSDQLAALMLKMNPFDFIRTERALYEYPELVQKMVLKEMLAASADTEFGREHHFARIGSVRNYQRKMPLTVWEDYDAYAGRLAKGESDLLFPGKATFFYRTSGTTQAFKFIPESEREAKARKALTQARNYELLLVSTLGAIHRVFAFFNKSGLDVTEGGIECGTASGRTSQLNNPKLLKRLAYSPQLVEEFEGEELYYMIMRCTLVYDDVSAILGNNAKMMTTLVEYAQDHAEELIGDIRSGGCRYPVSDRLKALEADALRPCPGRADELEALFKAGKLTPRYYWPEIKSASFWLGGSVGVHVREVKELLPETTCYMDVGYGASEAKINIPLTPDTPAGPLSIFSSFYEFIPEEGGEPLLAHELEDGKNYELVLTTYGGLYRYRLKDLVRVEGFTGRTPNVYFLSKLSDVANLGQEKIPGAMLIEAIRKIAVAEGMGFESAQVYPDPEAMSYVVCIETDRAVEDIRAFRETMDASLMRELEQYRIYRGRLLHKCGLVLMKEGWLEALTARYTKGNATAAQVKIPVVIQEMPDRNWIAEEDRGGEPV